MLSDSSSIPAAHFLGQLNPHGRFLTRARRAFFRKTTSIEKMISPCRQFRMSVTNLEVWKKQYDAFYSALNWRGWYEVVTEEEEFKITAVLTYSNVNVFLSKEDGVCLWGQNSVYMSMCLSILTFASWQIFVKLGVNYGDGVECSKGWHLGDPCTSAIVDVLCSPPVLYFLISCCK
jgi:hypothetical protein